MKHVTLSNWSGFESTLRRELAELSHHWMVTVRVFERVGFEGSKEVDRLKRALRKGTDRTKKSPFWNEPEHDYDHDRWPSTKRADEIIYAFTLNLDHVPYKVLQRPDVTDISNPQNVTDAHAIIVYDYAQLEKKSPNEYWFKGSPKDAALLIFTVEEPTEECGEDEVERDE